MGVASDGDLHIGGPGERGMAARPSAVDAAVVHDNDDAGECVADGFGRREVGAHILILGHRSKITQN